MIGRTVRTHIDSTTLKPIRFAKRPGLNPVLIEVVFLCGSPLVLLVYAVINSSEVGVLL